MRYVKGDAFETAAMLWATLRHGQSVYIRDALYDAEAVQKVACLHLLADLADGHIYRAIPAPEVRCPVCQSETVRATAVDGEWIACNTCGCFFDPAAVKPCPECEKAKAERDDYKGRCERATRYIDKADDAHIGLTHGGVVTALAILRGEGRG